MVVPVRRRMTWKLLTVQARQAIFSADGAEHVPERAVMLLTKMIMRMCANLCMRRVRQAGRRAWRDRETTGREEEWGREVQREREWERKRERKPGSALGSDLPSWRPDKI